VVAKREGDPTVWAHDAWWSCGGREGGGTDLTPTETGGASHVRAGEGEGKAGRWPAHGVGSS
jgi:hypothetical protein